MLTPTHLMVMILAAALLRLDRNEWFIALLFGVVVDADHLFAMPRYVSDNGWSAVLRQTWDDGSGLPWKSWLHYPMAAILVGHLSMGWRFAIPLSFWALHVGMDGLQIMLGDANTAVESCILAGSTAGVLVLAYRSWAASTGMSGAKAYLGSVATSPMAALSGIFGLK